MKKKVWAVIIAAGIFYMPTHAQLKIFSIGPYVEAAAPTGDFKETNKNGYGAGLNMDVRLSKFGLTGSAGIMHFGGKTILNGEGSGKMPGVTAIPVRVGIKYHFAPLLYFKIEGGTANYTNGDKNAFILSPGIGVRVLGLDVQLKYESWIQDGSRSFAGLKAGYNF